MASTEQAVQRMNKHEFIETVAMPIVDGSMTRDAFSASEDTKGYGIQKSYDPSKLNQAFVDSGMSVLNFTDEEYGTIFAPGGLVVPTVQVEIFEKVDDTVQSIKEEDFANWVCDVALMGGIDIRSRSIDPTKIRICFLEALQKRSEI